MTYTLHGKADLTGLCVLIAEDDFLLALSLEASVEDLGGEVMGPVAMAADGIARVRKTAPHMAFLDVQLRDGLVTPLAEVLARLGVPFALITGYQGEELKQIAFEPSASAEQTLSTVGSHPHGRAVARDRRKSACPCHLGAGGQARRRGGPALGDG